ncbi:MAG: hypothetical protein H0V19_03335 [Euzebyales bacterium]|nr:hypothetical protein [Euzebyales bacterium]
MDQQPGGRGGLYGFLALFAAVCDRVAADGVVVGFDCRTASARRRRWPGYKANRAAKDPALDELLDLAPTVLVELGVDVAVVDGWEADDVLGSVAAAAAGAGWGAVLATSDRDAFALIGPSTTVLRLRSGMDNAVEVTAASLLADVGVRAEQYVEFAALRGDASDNLPGVTGIGAARAVALLRAYERVDLAAADPLGCRSVLGRTIGQALLDDLADAGTSVFRRNVSLMSIRRDLRVDLARCRPTIPAERIAERLDVWGLGALAGRLSLCLAARPEPVPLPDGPPA